MRRAFNFGEIRAKIPLRVRLALFACLFAAPVLLLAVVQIHRDTLQIHRDATAAVIGTADALARRLAQDLAGAESVARAIGAVDLDRPGAAAACSLALQLGEGATAGRVTNYIVATPGGQVRCSGQPLRGPVNVGDRPHVRQALQTGQPVLSGFVVGRVSTQELVQLAVPVVDAGNRVTAVAVAGLAAAGLVSELPAAKGPPLTLLMFDRDGVLVSRSPSIRSLPSGLAAGDSDLFRQRVALAHGTTELRGLDGVPRIYASRAVELRGEPVLWVLSGLDVRALDTVVLAAGFRDVGIVLLLAGVVAGIAYVATRSLVLRRYRGLISVVADVAVGKYSSRVAVIVQDDVTVVERAFNSMLVAVEADRTELERANGALLGEIARREKSESALRERELELDEAKRVAGLGGWSLHAGGSLEWTPETLAILGRDPALGPPSRAEQANLLTPASLSAMNAALRKILNDGAPYGIELECNRPDGTNSWMIAHGEAVVDAVGAVVGARGTVLDITERKLAELAVRRSQSQLRHLMDGLGSAIFVGLLTPEGILVQVNQSPLTARNLQAHEVLGMPFADTPWWRGLPPAQEQLRAGIIRAAGGESFNREMRIHGRHGTAIDIDFSLQPLRDDSGQVIFLVCSAVDITERKRAETALRESEAEFRALTDAMPQIVWMTQSDGKVTYFNQQWTAYTGMTFADSCGDRWSEVFHPDDRQAAWAAWQQATATGALYMQECRLRGADGAFRWWLLRGEPQRNDTGAVVKWVGTCTDIHSMKLAELEISRANRELQQQQTELRVLFDLMPALILFKDTENRILRINQHGAEAAGRTVEDIEGRPTEEIYPETGAEGHLADLEVIRSGRPQLGTVHKIRDRQGKDRWIQRDRVPYRDVSGKVIGIVLMVQDITERKRDQDALREMNTGLESRVRDRTTELTLARSQAEEANRAKSDFLAAMSHEIRTPMSGLLGLLELLQLGTLDNEQHSTLSLARDSGNALMSMIDDILDFSKIEANRLDLNLVASSVKAIVENACRLHSQVASRKNLSLRLDVAPDISPLLAVDPLRLGQILNNFLNNAIKFTDSGGVHVVVDLLAHREGIQDLRFVVRDTGIGMTPEQLAGLFQPFVQAQPSTSTNFGGTGLGLVIARRLAELMGGTVGIESQAGSGTTLTLLLSFETCDEAASAQAAVATPRETLDALMMGRRHAPSIEEAEAEGTLLLLVDDHPTNRFVLAQQVASLGYAAQAASDGVQALALWGRHRFGAVITDCNMPGMNGYELAAQVRGIEQRSDARLHRVPIIACTANALQSALDLCIGAGMDDCLVKPADLAAVSAILDRWLPLPRGEGPGRQPAAPPAPPAPPAPHARGANGTEGFLDTLLLSEISGGNLAVQTQILEDFRHANEHDAASLRTAAGVQEFASVTEHSHRIKGASLMLGATRLGYACGQVEAAGAAGDAALLSTAMRGFELELLRLDGYLDTL